MALLQTVLQKLSIKRNALTRPALDSAASAVRAAEPCPLLSRLYEQRQLLEVIPRGSQRSYQSIIVAIDSARNLLWLDDLFPSQNTLETGDSITIRHHCNGEILSISTPIIAWGSDFGASGLAVVLPENLSYQPRRYYQRFELGEHLSLSAKIRTMGEEPVYGSIQDLSAGGMRILVAGNLLSQIHHDTLLPLCEINLSRELQIRCRARVCAFRLCRAPYRSTQISLEFVDLPPSKQQQLQKFIHFLMVQMDSNQVAA